MFGGRIGFFQGDVRKLMDDIKELKPTLFPTVPRLLNRVYDKVRWLEGKIFKFVSCFQEDVCSKEIFSKGTDVNRP